MLNHILPPDTQAILLLCASFGQNRQIEPQPLTLSEYNIVTSWLRENQMTPRDLLNPEVKNKISFISIGKLNSQRLISLLERGVMLSLAVEKWTNQGLWILGRSDEQYPKRFKQKLKHSAPPILYGVGNIELLSQGGLAVVGSRDVDEEGISYTQRVVETCANQGIQIISGGARGVDQASMLGVLEAGGIAVGVLADSLVKTAVMGKYRTGIKEGRLTLVSAYDPEAKFNVGNAMGRNKYIYALSDYALVVSSSVNQGGTWAGAVETLEKMPDFSVFVRMEGSISEGNQQLLNRGAKPFPETPWHHPLRNLLESQILEIAQPQIEVIASEVVNVVTDELSKDLLTASTPPEIKFSHEELYKAILPFILYHLEQPKDAKSLAECLDVRLGQIQDWLNRLVADGKVKKNKKPVTYQLNQQANLLSFLEPIQ